MGKEKGEKERKSDREREEKKQTVQTFTSLCSMVCASMNDHKNLKMILYLRVIRMDSFIGLEKAFSHHFPLRCVGAMIGMTRIVIVLHFTAVG